ncbi:MAG: hypothetical protein QXP53_01235 [Candidatus Pacearchaeota archaeon]
MELSDRIAKGWIRTFLLFEIIGKPKEHIIEVLNLLVKKLGELKGVHVINSKIHDAKKVAGQSQETKEKLEEVFSSFAEVEILAEKLSKIIEIIFDYMPSSIEISEPKDLKINLSDANALLNDLATRLHQYHMATHALKAERDILFKRVLDMKKKAETKK